MNLGMKILSETLLVWPPRERRGDEVDDATSLRLFPDWKVVPIRSVAITSNREGHPIGTAEIYFERVDVQARCHFNSTADFLGALVERSRRPLLKVGSEAFIGRVVIDDANVRVALPDDGHDLPVISATVYVQAGKLVTASIIFPDETDAGWPECWSPEQCAALLEACGWQLGEAP